MARNMTHENIHPYKFAAQSHGQNQQAVPRIPYSEENIQRQYVLDFRNAADVTKPVPDGLSPDDVRFMNVYINYDWDTTSWKVVYTYDEELFARMHRTGCECILCMGLVHSSELILEKDTRYRQLKEMDRRKNLRSYFNCFGIYIIIMYILAFIGGELLTRLETFSNIPYLSVTFAFYMVLVAGLYVFGFLKLLLHRPYYYLEST